MLSKRILLLTTPMDGYELDLITSLESKGFIVDFFKEGAKIKRNELNYKQLICRLLTKIIPIRTFVDKFNLIEKNIYQKHIDRLNTSYDLIFDFAGKGRSNCLELLKKKYKATFILYLWDDMIHNPDFRKNIHYFDKVFTFNKLDAEKYGFFYRPNFYTNEYLYAGQKKTIDIFYKGTARDMKRSVILKKIIDELNELNLDISLFSKGGYIKNCFRVVDAEFFRNHCNAIRLSNQTIAEKSKNAKALIDINFENQNGIGLRPIQALASQSKIITTNPNILNYEIYHPNNIFLLKDDLSNLHELRNFMGLPFLKRNHEEIYHYSIDGFINQILKTANSIKPGNQIS